MGMPFNTPAFHVGGRVPSFSLLQTGRSILHGGYGSSSLHKIPKGSVYFQEVADWSFEDDYPAVIDPATLLSAIQGIVTEDVKKFLNELARWRQQADEHIQR